MRYNNRRLNCSNDGSEQQTIKAQLKDWCQKFFEEEDIYPTADFVGWDIQVHRNTDGKYFARMFVNLDAEKFLEVITSAKIPATYDSAAIAEAAKTMVDWTIADLIDKLEDLITEQLTLRLDDKFSFLPIDVTVRTSGNNSSEWSADVVIEELESEKTTEPEYFDAMLEFTLDSRSIMTSIADCADYIKYQY